MVKKKRPGYHKKKRNSGQRVIKHILLIAAEGNNKTEKLYFQNFNQKSISIKFVSGDETAPEQLAERLLNEARELELQQGDMAISVIDTDYDSKKNKQISEADKFLRKAKKKGLDICQIVSNPCFEIWYLCHFIYSTKNFNNTPELLKDLEKYVANYQKGENIYPKYLQNLTFTAIKNAKKLENYCMDSGKKPHTVDFSPSTEVYKVFEMFINKYSIHQTEKY